MAGGVGSQPDGLRPDQRRTEADLATTDSERCIKAVLAATVYPGTQGTVDLKIKLVHVTPEDARELLSFLNPFISSLTNH